MAIPVDDSNSRIDGIPSAPICVANCDPIYLGGGTYVYGPNSKIGVNVISPPDDGGGGDSFLNLTPKVGTLPDPDMYDTEPFNRPPSRTPTWADSRDSYLDLQDYYNKVGLNSVPPAGGYQIDYTCLPSDLYTEYAATQYATLQSDFDSNCRWAYRATSSSAVMPLSVDLTTSPPTAVMVMSPNMNPSTGDFDLDIWERSMYTGDNSTPVNLSGVTPDYEWAWDFVYGDVSESGTDCSATGAGSSPIPESPYLWRPLDPIALTSTGAAIINVITNAQADTATFSNTGTDDMQVMSIVYHTPSNQYLMLVSVGAPSNETIIVTVAPASMETGGAVSRTYVNTAGNQVATIPTDGAQMIRWIIADDGTTLLVMTDYSNWYALLLDENADVLSSSGAITNGGDIGYITHLARFGTDLVGYAFLSPGNLLQKGIASWFSMPATLSDWNDRTNWTHITSGINPDPTPDYTDGPYQYPLYGDHEPGREFAYNSVQTFPGLYSTDIPVFNSFIYTAGDPCTVLTMRVPTWTVGGTGCANIWYNRGFEIIEGESTTWTVQIEATPLITELGGFGLMFCDSDFSELPGKTTDGAALYIDDTGWQICINSSCESISSPGFLPSSISIRVSVIDNATMAVTWWADNELIATRSVAYDCNKWIPTVALCNTGVEYRIDNSDLINYPGIEYYIDCDISGCVIWRMVTSGAMWFQNSASDQPDAEAPLYIVSTITSDDGDVSVAYSALNVVSTLLEQLDIVEECAYFVSVSFEADDVVSGGLIIYSETVDEDLDVPEGAAAFVSEIVDIDDEIAEYLESGQSIYFVEIEHTTIVPTVDIPIVPAGSPVYVMNMETTGITRYTGLDLVGLVEHEGQTIFATEDAILINTGSTDAGSAIVGVIGTGDMHFGTEFDKHCTKAYVTGVPSSTLTLQTKSDENGTRVERSYSIASVAGDEQRTRFTKLGRGARSPYWAFELANTSGGEFHVRSVVLLVSPSKRPR